MSQTLPNWLLKQIAEREEFLSSVAKQEHLRPPKNWYRPVLTIEGAIYARVDVNREKVELDGKRRIIKKYNEIRTNPNVSKDPTLYQQGVVLEAVLKVLALPYADQPGYNKQWRP